MSVTTLIFMSIKIFFNLCILFMFPISTNTILSIKNSQPFLKMIKIFKGVNPQTFVLRHNSFISHFKENCHLNKVYKKSIIKNIFDNFMG
jgi:hypothetical protein